MERGHDVGLGNAGPFQIVAEAVFRAVTLYPDLAVDNVQMENDNSYPASKPLGVKQTSLRL